ncbi:MAG: ATP-dependent helicase C-terminal domain-containing protein [Chthoniobacter sp.]
MSGEIRIRRQPHPFGDPGPLAPNHRPIQITQNLATFWKDSYPKIKQELQRKYPKHDWR